MRTKTLVSAVTVFLLAIALAACNSGGGGGESPTILSSIEVTPTNPSVALGATYQFKATGTYSDSSTQDMTTSVTWSSTDEAKATVSATGLATLNAAGPTTITATAGGVSGNTTITVRSNVNAVNLPQTGQTVSQAAGDDGSLQRGVAWPNPRFTNSDGTAPVTGSVVVDQLTGLMWLKDANCIKTNYASFDNDSTVEDGAVTWQHALDFVAGINAGTYPGCGGGHTDWRMPNRKELRSLINYGQVNTAIWLNTQGFSNVQAGFYWSSTTYAAVTTRAWYVTMYYGVVSYGYKTDDNYVWPVRSGQ